MTNSSLTSGVYLITHQPTGMRYVGASLRPHQRIRSHYNRRHCNFYHRLPLGLNTPITDLHSQILEFVEVLDRYSL